ncbi:MAG: DUF2069 domain-containing protein [Gammaproteobacteria bacterium]
MRSVDLPRRTAIAGLAAAVMVLLGWLGPAATAHGPPALIGLAILLAPLALGISGLLRARVHTARWLSLALPFYGAGLLVAAVGNPAARGWVTAGAFALALAFAALLSWVKRGAQPPLP